jgi:hypothetical protein
MTIEATSQSANPWAVGMPELLAASVFHCDKATRRTIIQNWAALGEPGRHACHAYLTQPRLSWRRRERVREVISRLRTTGDPRPTTGA